MLNQFHSTFVKHTVIFLGIKCIWKLFVYLSALPISLIYEARHPADKLGWTFRLSFRIHKITQLVACHMKNLWFYLSYNILYLHTPMHKYI